MVSLTELHLRAARARIAALVMPTAVEPALGSIRLREDQCTVAGRVAAALARDGGCLLADDVGRGKTYVALAIAREWARPLVVVPAALRSTWTDAMRRAGVPCAMISHEELSRGRMPSERPDGIVVDESHHFRSTSARRYSVLVALSFRAPLLLLSATPLQNRPRDLAAQVALFHGARAFALDAAALATFVVRSGTDDGAELPTVAPPVWVHPAVDDGAVLNSILELPPPARPVDGGDAGALRTIGLVRAWASSRAALRAAMRGRRRIATAIEQSVSVGRVPTRRELSAWTGTDDAIQLGFASLLACNAADDALALDLSLGVACENAALTRLEAALASSSDPDEARVSSLRRIRSQHSAERVLVFTEFASTARAFFARMRDDAGIALLTATDARIANGRLSRDALLERFAPRAQGAPDPPDRERITLLIATDVLSEGLNLQDASVVVHLDLPWNPARLAQRVGRVRRPGGAAVVHAYLLAPPARAERLLEVERRLRTKLAAAAHTIGRGIEVVPRLTEQRDVTSSDVGRATLVGETAEGMARWRRRSGTRTSHPGSRPLAASATCAEAGWLAALDDGQLVASFDGAPADTHTFVARAVMLADGPARPVEPDELRQALAQCERWLGAQLVAERCGGAEDTSGIDVALDQRIARTLERAPRHLRPVLARQASQLVTSLRSPRPLGVERALRRLLDETVKLFDPAWLSAALELATPRADPRRRLEKLPRVAAMILLGPWRRRGVPTAWPSPSAPAAERSRTPSAAPTP